MVGALALLVACSVMAAAASAQLPDLPDADRPFELTADSVEYESARSVYVARGNVRIVSGDTELTADWMAFNDERDRGIATGGVVYRAGEDELVAGFVAFNIDSRRGILFDGQFVSDEEQFRMEGREIVKRGDDSYSFEKGMFTTCRCLPGERDPWQIRAGSADLEVGGYATARNTTFEILGVPAVWLPWMIYPLKTERSTGLLFPDLGYGKRNGFQIGLPIFWTARDGLNVTFTPRWLSKRGFKGDVDLEYVFGERSEGEISGAFLYDQKIDPNSESDPFDRERWSLHGEQDIYLPWEFRAKSSFQFASDNEYVNDFDDLPADEDDRFLQSNAFAGRSFGAGGRFGGLAGLAYRDDLQNPDDRDRDKFLLQRLPTLAMAALPAAVVESVPVLSRIIPAIGFEYTHFATRERGVDHFDGLDDADTHYNVGDVFIDTGVDAVPTPSEDGNPPDPHGDGKQTPGGPELNGSFDEGEPLAAGGHRVDIFPRLAVPFRIGDYVEAYPEVGWHQSFYSTDLLGSSERHLLTARLDLRSRLVRQFGNGMTHLLEPRISYGLITDLGQDQDDLPLFVPKTAVAQQRLRQLDLTNVTLDDADRISKFNGLSFGIGNRIYGRRDQGGGSDLIADFYISNQIGLDDGDFGNIFMSARAYPLEQLRVWATLGIDPEEAAISEGIFEVGFLARSGHALQLAYRYLREIPLFFEDFESSSDRFDEFTETFSSINQIRVSGRVAITRQWSAYAHVSYTFEDSLLLRNRGGVEYVSTCGCWAAGFELGHSRSRGLVFNLTYRVLGLGREVQGVGLGGISLLDGI
jgi:lipopolysaccharide assembly outer membrane protein LptD (OstA)